jgi:hypothetical protein
MASTIIVPALTDVVSVIDAEVLADAFTPPVKLSIGVAEVRAPRKVIITPYLKSDPAVKMGLAIEVVVALHQYTDSWVPAVPEPVVYVLINVKPLAVLRLPVVPPPEEVTKRRATSLTR